MPVWPVDLRQTRDVKNVFHAEEGADLVDKGIARPLRPHNDLPEADLVLKTSLVDFLGHEERHGGGAAQDRRTKIDQELHLHVEVSRTRRYRKGAEALAAELESHPGGPHAVAHADLDPIQGRKIREGVAAGEHVGPVRDVFGRIDHDLPLARGSGGGVETHDAFERNGEKRERVVLLKVLRGDKGKPPQVGQSPDVARRDAGLVEPLPVEGRSLIGVPHGPLQPRKLQGLELFGRPERGHKGFFHGELLIVMKHAPALREEAVCLTTFSAAKQPAQDSGECLTRAIRQTEESAVFGKRRLSAGPS